MKLVFLAVQSNKTNKKILSVSEKNKQTITPYFIEINDPSIQKKFTKITNEIKKSDGLIIEGSTTEFDFGIFITNALQQHKSVLLLHTESLQPKTWMFGANRLLKVKEYDEKSLEQELKNFFLSAKKQKLTYRFNLMLDKEINSFLMDRAKEHDISKADYIRQLISKDMSKK